MPADFDDDDDLSALSFYAPDAELAASDLDALEGYEDDDEVVPTMFTVTNPPGTVTVSTFMDGSVRRIDLSQEVISMTEADLADEIVVIARLATQDARAAQYVHVLDGMRQQGHDDVATRDFLSRDLDLPSPEDASAARARVFATRYAGDHE
ncbi:YbaB/EbfC family DNA-binding protein [Mycobacterium sp. Root135]|uniref:YbaB/EbfC family DNA-binding protein n=1 Tax=Mycobacterium sp. Root135 TaxID=1736457 RepID=UPI0019112415|nr:YbaB/EbfC family DNA-binding protein [Mycobacterium sp. Root135]